MIDDTDEDPMLSSEVPGKQNPIEHSDTIPLSRSCSHFDALGHNDSTANYVSVDEPIPLHDLILSQ